MLSLLITPIHVFYIFEILVDKTTVYYLFFLFDMQWCVFVYSYLLF